MRIVLCKVSVYCKWEYMIRYAPRLFGQRSNLLGEETVSNAEDGYNEWIHNFPRFGKVPHSLAAWGNVTIFPKFTCSSGIGWMILYFSIGRTFGVGLGEDSLSTL